MITSAHIVEQIKSLNEIKRGLSFMGFDDGYWTDTSKAGLLDGWDWRMTYGLSRENGGNNYCVDGVTETHPGFIKALQSILKTHPEIEKYWIKFDGGWLTIQHYFTFIAPNLDWARIIFFHGTCLKRWEQIKKDGLSPRNVTGVEATYGVRVGAKSGRLDAIYLTNQLDTAKFAARECSKKEFSQPVILQIEGKILDPQFLMADEDSKEDNAADSFHRIGSVAYVGRISGKDIKPILVLENSGWMLPREQRWW
jgi:hypothetical protein